MKTVLITGANSGIGFSTVKLFLKKKYTVFAHYNVNKNNLNSINNKNLITIKADLTKIKEIKKLFDKTLAKTQTIDILVNNAAIYYSSEHLSEEYLNKFDETFNVNLKAPFLLSKMFIDVMKEYNKGKIINISSIGVKFGGSFTSMPYTLSKAALETMTLSFAKEGAKYNILVNALRIGVTDTNIHKNNKKKNIDERINMIPLKRMANPTEVSESILFLASSKSNFTTGSIITVAGGE